MIVALLIPIVLLFVFFVGVAGMAVAVLRRRRERLAELDRASHRGPGEIAQPPDPPSA